MNPRFNGAGIRMTEVHEFNGIIIDDLSDAHGPGRQRQKCRAALQTAMGDPLRALLQPSGI